MIKAKEAIRVARGYIGTPYAEMDCIHLIINVIRNSAGGVKDYRCQGTNWLWDSVNNSGKYQHLTSREEGLSGAQAGKLAFKRYGTDAEDHVGIVTGEGTVIHSSSVNGRGVVETPLTAAEGWDLLGVHRYIEVADGAAESGETVVMAYKMQVVADVLNVRSEPSTAGDRIGKLSEGAVVTVQAEYDNGWKFISYGDSGSGYVAGEYLAPYTEPEPEPVKEWTTLASKSGEVITLKGDWRVAED